MSVSEPLLRCPKCERASVNTIRTELVDGYLCCDCGHSETCEWDGPNYHAFGDRWGHPDADLSPEGLARRQAEFERVYEARQRAFTWPPDRRAQSREARLAEAAEIGIADHIENAELVAQVIANPDSDELRWAYAAWHSERSGDEAGDSRRIAEHVTGQLRVAEAFRRDPRADVRALLPRAPDASMDEMLWNYREGGPLHLTATNLATFVLDTEGIVRDRFYLRGFTEHVTIKAARFLEIAEELYGLAPIRHLTVTYCKGPDHTDDGVLDALLDSPHLDRILTLTLPVRLVDNHYTELNRLTDRDLGKLARSRHLRRLAMLDLVDQRALTVGGFDALAESTELPALSAVTHDLHHYYRVLGNWGEFRHEIEARPLRNYADEIERRHGREIPWLRPLDHYGTETPDREIVVEHPVALR